MHKAVSGYHVLGVHACQRTLNSFSIENRGNGVLVLRFVGNSGALPNDTYFFPEAKPLECASLLVPSLNTRFIDTIPSK
jgi:hypothetical protein